ncbi:bifunctional 6-phosphofructo-2-kinase/fructose-2,6-bisphosphate 2-phosphatase [Rozella allomycis CSF55]|nr:bifunctional 6-phosphofructo-2-kinase/fructose-2,6-bisphosphate 2-phosphatase [Rozella allomycis CSF55]
MAALEALNDVLEWFEKETDPMVPAIAIYDATNSTVERRKMILEFCSSKALKVMFIESICHDDELIMSNIKEVKLSSPDYVNKDPDQAAEDFKARIAHYQKAYETITEKDISFIKTIDLGTQFVLHLVQDYLQSRIVFYLMNLHIKPRSIFISRHGESMLNVKGAIGGDSDLSPRGRIFAEKLPDLIKKNLGDKKLTVWTSTLKRTIQSAEHLTYPKLSWKALDELDAGVCDGMTYEEIEEKYPEDFHLRDSDKYNYRYRGGESYHDLVVRLEPVIMELERQENILIISHQATLRCIYAYFLNLPRDELPYINIPLHTVIQLTPKAYGCEEVRYKL